jgi:hypothetical protein
MDIERRKTPRKKQDQLIYVEFGHDNGGMLRDLSEGGMGFRAVGPVRQGQKVPFAFSFAAGKQLAGEAELSWTDAEGKSGGLRFLNAAEELRGTIRNWLGSAGYPAMSEEQRATAATMPRNTLEELRQELRGETSQAVAEDPVLEARKRISAEAPASIFEALPVEARPEESATALPSVAVPEMNPRALVNTPFEKEIRVAQEPVGSLEQEMVGTKWRENVTLGRAVGAMLVLTVMAASLVYHHEVGKSLIWLGEKIAGDEKPAQSPMPQQPALPTDSGTDGSTSGPTSGATNSAANTETTDEKQTATPVSPVAGTDKAQPGGTVPEVRQMSDHEANTDNASAAPPKSEDTGQNEFQQALQILGGKGQSDKLPEAVRLLWVAVGKGNSAAEVTLAELYRRGEGVPQSCDQTRVLLTAAARKGNGQAKTRLAEIEQTGCP